MRVESHPDQTGDTVSDIESTFLEINSQLPTLQDDLALHILACGRSVSPFHRIPSSIYAHCVKRRSREPPPIYTFRSSLGEPIP